MGMLEMGLAPVGIRFGTQSSATSRTSIALVSTWFFQATGDEQKLINRPRRRQMSLAWTLRL